MCVPVGPSGREGDMHSKGESGAGPGAHCTGGEKSWESSPEVEGLAPRVPPRDSFLQSQGKAGYRGSDAKGRHVWWRASEGAPGEAAKQPTH